MKSGIYTTFLITTIIVLSFCQISAADERNDFSGIFDENEPKEVMIDRMMDFIERTNPQMAEELADLREDNPEKFLERLRETGREMRERMHQPRRADPPRRGRADDHERGFRERSRESYVEATRKRNEEFMDWLSENYPSEAENIENLFESDPERGFRALMPVMARYREIFETEKRNPELAEVMKKDLDLRQRRDFIVAKIEKAQDEEEKQHLAGDLEKIIEARFDLIVYQRQIRFEQLRERLEQLEKEIAKQQASLEELNNQREAQIQNRLQELLGGQSKLIRWD